MEAGVFGGSHDLEGDTGAGHRGAGVVAAPLLYLRVREGGSEPILTTLSTRTAGR